ncbi:MAG: Serine-tRNA ligase [Candidatus Levybacteria bacterium GW2011_GWC2_37_7]|nr:MAG: Serine-tRNA ligase [Candidatus Levybacteria bacterium GW2011_GWC2_37_7]
MIDIKFLRENPEKIQKAAKDKNVDINVGHILEIDKKYKELSISVQKLREERNILTASMKGKPTPQYLKKGKTLKEKLEKEEHALKAVWIELKIELYKIPNPAKPDVKIGKNDTENKVLRKVGTPTKFSFKPKDHLEIGENLDIVDVARASKISGARFYFLKNEGVLLEFALRELAFEILLKEGFIPVLPPVLIKKEVMRGLGYMEKSGDEDMYILEKDGLVLVGTSEQSIVSMHKDEILNVKDLPKRYVGFSTCFRREAGSYGKDTRGILRAHQFDKIEMVSFVAKGEDDKEHEYLLSLEEKLLQALGIPYQVVKMCTGDLGFPAARKYDLEAWIPSENKYREVTSASTTTDFQARRLNIKYSAEQNKKEFVNILNGTAFSARPIIAMLENYQQEDGSVLIPKILQKYLNCEKISAKNQ